MRNRNYFTRMKTYFQTSFILLIACFCSGSYTQMDSYISMGNNPLTYQIHSGEVSYEEKMADHIEANKENVKEEIVEPVKQELESVTEEEEVKPVVEEPKLKEGWARGVVHSEENWKSSY